MKYVFFDVQKNISSESVFNTLYIQIKQILKRFPPVKVNGTKNALFCLARSNSSEFYF